jgi:protein phosphatase
LREDFLATSVVHYAAAAATDCGRKRPSNEDAFRCSVEHGVYLVCDGMGGAAAGEVASSIAVEKVMRLLSERAGGASLEERIRQAVDAANLAIYSLSQQNPKLSGMGTTLVGLALEASRVLAFNVGDSRCYLLRNGHLEQISLDHSLVEEQVRIGRMTHDEAQRSSLRNVITRALGTQSSVETDIFEVEAARGDLFLLCSDGLTGEVTDAEIEAILADGGSLEELCASLVKAANRAGGHDNITCLLVHAKGQ